MKAFFEARGSSDRFQTLLADLPHRSFTPADTVQFERTVAILGAAAMRSRPPFTCPVELTVRFVFLGDPDLWPTDVTDPDLDNVEKAVSDALNKVVFKDDRLVVRKITEKRCGPAPGVEIVVRPAEAG